MRIALIVAAGRGSRFGGELPKQYAPLAGSTVLRHALRAFLAHPGIDRLRVVIHPDDAQLYARAVAGLNLDPPIHGGATRQESVRLGLEALAAYAPQAVLIHDGARPLIPADVISRVLAKLAAGAQAVLPALPVTDTIKRSDAFTLLGEIERTGLFRAQTPQGFAYPAILAAHRQCAISVTDDTALMQANGVPVALVTGDERNLKVTTQEDLARAEAYARPNLLPRVGTGFDVHRLVPGDHVMLCGVRIAHDHALSGHSDADVALHALTDALLGTHGSGDIGTHFPPSDPQWRGADSAIFLRHALELIRASGGLLHHVDVTIIGERPKIGPQRGAMIERLRDLLDLEPTRISVKATTTERLGFPGRGEGLAAQAAATVLYPA